MEDIDPPEQEGTDEPDPGQTDAEGSAPNPGSSDHRDDTEPVPLPSEADGARDSSEEPTTPGAKKRKSGPSYKDSRIDKRFKVSRKIQSKESAMVNILRIVVASSMTYRPPVPQPRRPKPPPDSSPRRGVWKIRDAKRDITSPRRTRKGVRPKREPAEYPGLASWHAENKYDYSHQLKVMLRSGPRFDEQRDPNDKKAVSTEFIQTPLSWYSHIQRLYRGNLRTYPEAVQILSYVTSKYVTGRFKGDLLLVPAPRLCALFGMSESVEQLAVKYLVDNGYLSRIVVRGYIPWDDNTRGTWRFLLPRFDRLIAITYQ